MSALNPSRQPREGSTSLLLQLCGGYFIFYTITGLTVKYFIGSQSAGLVGMPGLQFLVYSTLGGTGIALSVVLVRKWYRMESEKRWSFIGLNLPWEARYIIPSGVCTAVIIPTTTLMYSLPISVLVAMTIMRGSVILISRAVDAIQIRQGILTKKVYWQENVGVLFAMGAVGAKGGSSFDFVSHPAALAIFWSYIAAYAMRIYIMNFFKNTRPKGAKTNNKAFYAIEQIAASTTLFVILLLVVTVPHALGWNIDQFEMPRLALVDPPPMWAWAILAGTAFGIVSFFSVFIFMYKGRTATFAGLVNRLTSLLAGTAATLLFALLFSGRWPVRKDWIALAFIIVAVGFLAKAEKRRAAELVANT